jgi:L-threonylcarbamoyladenylate synthase
MERMHLTDKNSAAVVARAAAVVRAGGVIVYPTDTLYGLGADAFSDAAVAKIHAIKGREEHKPMHAIVVDLAMAETYGEITGSAKALAEKFGGEVTLVVNKRPASAAGIAREMRTFGFRIPDNGFCIAIAREFGRPITATSANKSGAASPCRIDAILSQLGASAHMIDLVIDAGELPASKPSTVVDVSGAGPVIIREGAIPAADIRGVVKNTAV